jgi:hypothetical protein
MAAPSPSVQEFVLGRPGHNRQVDINRPRLLVAPVTARVKRRAGAAGRADGTIAPGNASHVFDI